MEINLIPGGAMVTFRERRLLVLKPKPWPNTEPLETHTQTCIRIWTHTKNRKHARKTLNKPVCTNLTGVGRFWGLRRWPGKRHRSEKSCLSSDSRSGSAGWGGECDTADRAPGTGFATQGVWTRSSPTCKPTSNQQYQHHLEFFAN